ncbi:MAG: twin transmembrane helix small protein [Proteobacteria bacterium]|nr:twin transmembrane helix small protein [Pseudomonadota bacterium]
MTTTFFLKILLIGAMTATVGALVLGLFNMLKDGKKADIRSNKMMRLRILFQALAILIFSLLLFFKGH